MSRLKKIIFRTFFVFVIIIPLAAFAHYIVFPQETRSILISCSNFKNDGRLYFNAATPQNKIDTLNGLIQKATERVAAFWGQKTCNPTFIYCYTKDDFKKYSISPAVPAVTYLKSGSYIVLSNEGAGLDIIAHEMSHAELYERIGFYNKLTKIPMWFDEGLAMQNDYRNYYSEDTLKVKSSNFKNMPGVKLFKTGAQFYAGDRERIMLNYMAARHEVKNWYTKEKLDKLIKDLNSGISFEEAYGK
jgi:hypothetical protein